MMLLPARALPLAAALAWAMVALAGLGELYARDRPDLLARGRAFAAAGVGLYVVLVAFAASPSEALAAGASGARSLPSGALASALLFAVAGKLVMALLFLMVGTTTCEVLSIANVRTWGRDFLGSASAWIRWTMLALAAVCLAEVALAAYIVHSLAGFTR